MQAPLEVPSYDCSSYRGDYFFFLALEKMAHLPLESMKEGGFEWIKDLTVLDATWALLAIASLIFLGSGEVSMPLFVDMKSLGC